MANNNHPTSGLIESALQNLRSLADANTVIGESITTPDGTVIIPVCKVSFGFGSGGTDIPTAKNSEPFGGGAGGGMSVQPLAFLVVNKGKVELLQLNDSKNTADRLVGIVPEMFDKISDLISQKAKKDGDGTQEKDGIPS